MTTQKQVRFDIYNELEQVTSGVVDSVNITDTQPHKREDFPAIVHSYEVRENPLNRGGAAPVRTTYTNNEADSLVYSTLHVASFTITVARLVATNTVTTFGIERYTYGRSIRNTPISVRSSHT